MEKLEIVYKSMEAMLTIFYVVYNSFDTVVNVFTVVPSCLQLCYTCFNKTFTCTLLMVHSYPGTITVYFSIHTSHISIILKINSVEYKGTQIGGSCVATIYQKQWKTVFDKCDVHLQFMNK
jgi:hypothetical protein